MSCRGSNNRSTIPVVIKAKAKQVFQGTWARSHVLMHLIIFTGVCQGLEGVMESEKLDIQRSERGAVPNHTKTNQAFLLPS